MSSNYPPIEYGKYYHVYNRGNNSENLFRTTDNYKYFISLFDKYIDPVAETYAWCLMPNHFHFLIRVKDEHDIQQNLLGLEDLEGLEKGFVSRQFSNLFNAYSKAFNRREGRHGSLFEHPFRRIEVNSEDYLRQLVYYIHSNPVNHGFVDDMIEYPWSSYLTLISIKSTKLNRDPVIGWFDSRSNFIAYHKEKQDLDLIKFSLLEK